MKQKKTYPGNYFELLDKNKTAFINATTEDLIEHPTQIGKDNAHKILGILRAVFKKHPAINR